MFSDNIIIAIPCSSDKGFILRYMITMIGCLQLEFIKAGILIRGSIVSGMLCINNSYVFGSGLVQAHKLENEVSVFPRIIIERKLIKLVD